MPDRVTKSIIVKADVATAYKLWADFENFPHFMRYIESVHKTGPKTSTWVVAGPLGRKVEWQAETTRMDENQRIGWSTKDAEGFTTSGDVVFSPLPEDQTQITVNFQYVPPAGRLGQVVADLFANLDNRIEEDLRNYKAYVEGMPGRITGKR
jgi:uncharacterized membrane protein